LGSCGRLLADELRALKECTGASYESLGRRLNASGSTLHRYCSGAAVPPTFHVVEQLAKQCGADADEVNRLRQLWELAAAEATARTPAAPSVAPVTDAGHEPAGATLPPADPAPAAPTSGRRYLFGVGGNRRVWLAAGVAVVAVVALVVVVGPWLVARPPQQAAAHTGESIMRDPSATAGCVSRSGVRHTDPFHDDRVYTVDFLCPNDADATLVSMSNFTTKVAYMQTTSSWFLCWTRRPAAGGSGTKVWYYTQGDKIAPGAEHWVAWGFVSADQVHTPVHPVPGMSHC
jgi:transcriptional regulator with XRE-family HTH domain